jgi:cytochrome c-type biogenesis protein CcmH
MTRVAQRILGLVLLLAAGVVAAQAPEPSEQALEQRLKTLSAELRCLVCQNQSLADSHAELAVDLKNQVRDLMRAGRSDEEIKDYLTQRYGDFVLYRPPVKRSTWLLWVGPFVLLAGGLWVLLRTLRRRNAVSTTSAAPAVDAAARERARALLAGEDKP